MKDAKERIQEGLLKINGFLLLFLLRSAALLLDLRIALFQLKAAVISGKTFNSARRSSENASFEKGNRCRLPGR